jgi:DMSO/TMAO reductase YedYZ molybdopterin-dependent catalytic subunit
MAERPQSGNDGRVKEDEAAVTSSGGRMVHASTPGTASDRPVPPGWRRAGIGALTGLVTGGVAIGVAHLVAGLINPEASPVITVGQGVIDASPEWLKSFAIRTFGSNDKLVLLAGIGVVIALLAVGLGIAAGQRRWMAMAALVGFGAVGVIAALTRPTAEPSDVVPAVAGVLAGALVLVRLERAAEGRPLRSTSSRGTPRPREEIGSGVVDRRRFFVIAGAGAALAAVAGGAGNLFARRFRADESRAAVRIPPPASPAVARTGLAAPDAGLPPFFTPNDAFYRVDTALLVPSVRAEDWKLRIHGMVDHEVTLTYGQLLARPLIERDVTLTCVSNDVGGRYVGNARWIGAPLKDILEEAGVRPGATQILSRSVDGFTVGTPTAVVMDGRDAMLAVAMNGEPLPIAHGFPVRMVVPGLYGYVSATKWVVDMELTTFDRWAYWIQRGWAQQGPIKTMSRIDVPRSGATLPSGEVTVAGIAWAQHTGIQGVEVRVDDGPWTPAQLAGEDTIDTWRQWVHRWDATMPGKHTVQARATDHSGYTQTAVKHVPFPSGATGYHTVYVRVA